MSGYNQNGDWEEIFTTPTYDTRDQLEDKIRSVIDFHVIEGGWVLNGEVKTKQSFDGKYYAEIPLKKPALENNRSSKMM